MVLLFLALIAGGVGLYYGGEWLLKGSVSLALRLKISTFLVGLVIVSFGTSTPELFISLLAVAKGNPEISIGNIVGSNIANIGLILGTTGLITTIFVNPKIFRFELPLLFIISVVYLLTCLDLHISRIDGVILFIGLAILIFVSLLMKESVESDDEDMALLSHLYKDIGFIIGGLVVLYVGSELFVHGAAGIAEYLGVPKIVIGLTVVALGTSLPELVTSIMAAMKKQIDLAVGNVIGSNIFNICLIQAIVAIVHPIDCPLQTRNFDLPVALGFVVLLIPLLWIKKSLNRFESALLLVGYFAYIGYTVVA